MEKNGGVSQDQGEAMTRDLAKGQVYNDDLVVISKKGLLAFMVEAMWRVKMVANKKSDVAREIASAAGKFLGFKGINPKELWESTFTQDSADQGTNGSQQIELDDNEEEEMDSRHEEYEGD